MNKIFLTTIFSLLAALAASAGASYWLALNPPFQTDPSEHAVALEDFGKRLFDRLHLLPEEDWEEALSEVDGVDNYYIDWFKAADYDEAVEDFAELSSRNQVLATLIDGTPVLELLIPGEAMVVEVLPYDGYDRRQLLNSVVTVAAVLLIGLLAALLTLYPIARRLRKLQSLADAYRGGDLTARNSDTAADAIGKLGMSMESMADQVDNLLNDKEQLVNDQQALMRAVAHEFRAPMARMRFALEMHESSSDFPTESKHEVSTALEELDDLVTEVLRYARLQHSAPPLQCTEVSLSDMIRESIAAVQALRADVAVQVDNPYQALTLVVDPVQFQRALRNLVSNALKYTNDRVSVGCEIAQQELVISVDDNGPGIDKASRKSILAPFVRLDSSRTRSLGGAGLGLAIVNGVVTKHGGRVEIADSVSAGASVRMILPATCYY